MNKTFAISVVVMFVVSMALGFVVHGLILGQAYASLPNLFRGEQDQAGHFGYMILAHVFIAIGFTWIYRQGRESKPWLMQGVRFGLAVAVLTTIPIYLIYFAVQPLPSDLVAQQIVYDTIATVIMGIVVAAVNRDPVPARA
jgi:membrane protease YdiL (CAAX protease family)